ncbi:MAG: hypothetical protein LBL26_10655 [Peptococcaceae bacterium]|jgi:hypothetical protein|nr:hypothetical protein [Peptococcaceae bacterium]
MNTMFAVSAMLAALVLPPAAAACPVRAYVSIAWENGSFRRDIVLTVCGRTFYRTADRKSKQKKKTDWRYWRGFFREEIRQIILEKLDVKVVLNAGSPWATAMGAGVLWGIVPSAANWFAKHFDARYLKPDLRVQPEYSGELRWSLTADCILNAPLDHIIFMLQRWIWHRIQNRFRRRVYERSSH